MRTHVLFVMLVAVVLFGWVHGDGDAPGDDRRPDPPFHGRDVAFVDIRYVLSHCAVLDGKLDGLEAEMELVRSKRAGERQEILDATEELLATQRPGTAGCRSRKDELSKREIALNATSAAEEFHFRRRRAELLYAAYREIENVISDLMQEHEILAVINFDGEETPQRAFSINEFFRKRKATAGVHWRGEWVQEVDADRIEPFIARPVVAVERKLDITPFVLQRLNAESVESSDERKPRRDR